MAVILQQGFLWRKEHGNKVQFKATRKDEKIPDQRTAASSVQHKGECDQDKQEQHIRTPKRI